MLLCCCHRHPIETDRMLYFHIHYMYYPTEFFHMKFAHNFLTNYCSTPLITYSFQLAIDNVISCLGNPHSDAKIMVYYIRPTEEEIHGRVST